MRCISCKAPLTGRSDKTYCGHACRMRAYRARQRDYVMDLELVAGIEPARRRFS